MRMGARHAYDGLWRTENGFVRMAVQVWPGSTSTSTSSPRGHTSTMLRRRALKPPSGQVSAIVTHGHIDDGDPVLDLELVPLPEGVDDLSQTLDGKPFTATI